MEVVAKLLEEVRDLLDHKDNITIVLSSDRTSWNTMFSPPLYLNPNKNTRWHCLAWKHITVFQILTNPTTNLFTQMGRLQKL